MVVEIGCYDLHVFCVGVLCKGGVDSANDLVRVWSLFSRDPVWFELNYESGRVVGSFWVGGYPGLWDGLLVCFCWVGPCGCIVKGFCGRAVMLLSCRMY